MKRKHWLYLAAMLGGAAMWIAVSLVSGRREAWDSSLYFSVGIPAVCLLSMVLAFRETLYETLDETSGWWQWGVLPIAGQFVWMLVSQGPGNLLPAGLIVFGVLSVPSSIAAAIGAFVARKAGKS